MEHSKDISRVEESEQQLQMWIMTEEEWIGYNLHTLSLGFIKAGVCNTIESSYDTLLDPGDMVHCRAIRAVEQERKGEIFLPPNGKALTISTAMP